MLKAQYFQKTESDPNAIISASSRCRKENKRKSKVIYVWKSFRVLKAELGEELAKDLASRHLASDPNMMGKFVRRYLDCNTADLQMHYNTIASFRLYVQTKSPGLSSLRGPSDCSMGDNTCDYKN